jgi:hypothetical protein
MKNKLVISLLALFLLPKIIYSQTGSIGIRTATPSATLDILANGNTNTTKALEINNSSNLEMMTVLNNGNIGINNSNPIAKLNMTNGRIIISAANNPGFPFSNSWHDIAASTGESESVILRLVNTSPLAVGNTSLIGFNANNAGGSTWGLGTRQTTLTNFDSRFFIGWSNGGGYYERLVLSNNGDLTIQGANAIKPGGGTWAATSDFRVKKEIKPYIDGLKQLLQINPVVFKYNGKGNTTNDNKNYIGVIAQDIQKIAPYTITETDIKLDDSNQKMLQLTDAGAFIYMTINAIKEQQIIIDSQQKEILNIKQQLEQQNKYLQSFLQK